MSNVNKCFEEPECLKWSTDDVVTWIKNLNLPQYARCLAENFIDGRKLILVDANNLTKMGVHNFEHIKIITQTVRELLDVEKPFWNVSIADHQVKPSTAYLEQKSRTGAKINALTTEEFAKCSFSPLVNEEL